MMRPFSQFVVLTSRCHWPKYGADAVSIATIAEEFMSIMPAPPSPVPLRSATGSLPADMILAVGNRRRDEQSVARVRKSRRSHSEWKKKTGRNALPTRLAKFRGTANRWG